MSSTSMITKLMLDIPWPEVLASAWKYGKRLFRGLSHEGIYEVLEYESVLELLNQKGTKAHFKKRKKVCYLQDNIIAYRDRAWGDGEIFQSYQCAPGKPVDRYRFDYKTYILISLREVKNRGDVDEFNIRWNIKDGFLRRDESWTTDINEQTKSLSVTVIFPKNSHPTKLTLVETNHRRTTILGSEHKKFLPDGRLRVTWKNKNPRLFEYYVIKWCW
jgi:hypothetical protein